MPKLKKKDPALATSSPRSWGRNSGAGHSVDSSPTAKLLAGKPVATSTVSRAPLDIVSTSSASQPATAGIAFPITSLTEGDSLRLLKSSLRQRLDSDATERERKSSVTSDSSSKPPSRRRRSSAAGFAGSYGYAPSVASGSEDTARLVEESEAGLQSEGEPQHQPSLPTTISEEGIIAHCHSPPPSSICSPQSSPSGVPPASPKPTIASVPSQLPTLRLPASSVFAVPPALADSALCLYRAPKGQATGVVVIAGYLVLLPLHTGLAIISHLPIVGRYAPASPFVPTDIQSASIANTTETIIRTGAGLLLAGVWSIAGLVLSSA